MDRESRCAAVRGMAESWTQLSNWTTTKQRMSRQNPVDFWGSKIIPYDFEMVVTCCKFVKTQDTIPKVNSSVKYVLWIVMMCRCTFIDCNKCSQCGMLTLYRRLCICAGKGYMEDFCTFWPVSKTTALKTAFKGGRWMQALGVMNDKGLYILRIRTQ